MVYVPISTHFEDEIFYQERAG